MVQVSVLRRGGGAEHVGCGYDIGGRAADAGAAAPGADLSAHSGAADLLCHLPVGVGVFPVDVHLSLIHI